MDKDSDDLLLGKDDIKNSCYITHQVRFIDFCGHEKIDSWVTCGRCNVSSFHTYIFSFDQEFSVVDMSVTYDE